MDYCFNGGCWGAVFAVPQSVVDNYIKLADEASIKVLLFVLRNSGRNLPEKDIADALNLNEEQVAKAFTFWENANIFKPSGKKSERNNAYERKTDAPFQIQKPKKQEGTSKRNHITPAEIAERVEKSEDVRIMFSMVEQNFGRPLNHSEQNSLIWMHDELGMPADVIIMIVAYCISIDKGKIGYIEKTAADWNTRGITTVESVQEELKAQNERKSYNGQMMKIFGIRSKLTPYHKKLFKEWREKGYSPELVEYACEKSIKAINEPSLPYSNKILDTWHEKGFTTKEQVDAENTGTRWQKNKLKEKDPSFDMDDYRSLVNDFGDK